MKVMTILGCRPELIKLSEIIKQLDKHTEHIFVHTGQNYDYELNEIFYDELGLRRPDEYLGVGGGTLAQTVSNVLVNVEQKLLDHKPDAVVILGDTNSALAGIIVKRMKIPLFHLEAGNRCFDDNVPEEINRRILDHISDVNLVFSENSRRYLLDEGIAKDRIFMMGSPMQEILATHQGAIKTRKILDELKIKPQEYFLVSLHRDENTIITENFDVLMDTLSSIGANYDLPVIVSTHPRIKGKIATLVMNDNVQFHKPFGFLDYIALQANAKCVISDSGTISEESAILGFPAITVRDTIERPEAVDVGSILMTGVDEESILNCLRIVEKPTTHPLDYVSTNCSERVLKIILGYTPYVNKYVWHKR